MLTPAGLAGRGVPMPPSKWPLLLLPLLLVAGAIAHTPPYPQVDLPDPGPCPPDPVPQLVVILEDDSRSTLVTDPDERRYPETRQAVAWMKKTSCNPRDVVVVGHFGARHEFVDPVPLASLDPEGRALQGPDPTVGMSHTFLKAPALEAAGLARRYAGHEALFVLVSDGWLERERRALRALRSFPGAIHVIALGEEPAWTSAWPPRPRLSVQVLGEETEFGEVARSLATIWTRSTRPVPAETPSPSP